MEQKAKEQGVQYVALDGDIGILGNGAGLVMSTLDVVAQAGGRPRTSSMPEVALRRQDQAGGRADPRQRCRQSGSLDIFGGITRCDEVAKGLIAAFGDIKPSVPFVVRLDGTNDVQGRELLQEAALPNVHAARTMNEAAEKVVELAAA